MGSSSSTPRTPRAIKIKVNTTDAFTSAGSYDNEALGKLKGVNGQLPVEDSSFRTMAVIHEDNEQTNNTEDTVGRKSVLDRTEFESRCESVVKEMRLLSVTPSHAMTPCHVMTPIHAMTPSHIISSNTDRVTPSYSTTPNKDRVSAKYRRDSTRSEVTSPTDNIHTDSITPVITTVSDRPNEDHPIVNSVSYQTDCENPIINGFSDNVAFHAKEEVEKLPKLTALFEKQWNASAPEDELPPWVHGVTSLTDGCVLILDLNNNALKLFDDNYDFVCAQSVSEDCCGISSVYSNEVAITCGNEVHFYFVDKTGFILQQRCFKLNGQGFGVCFSHKTYAITCDINKSTGSVRILNEKGKQRYVIKSTKVFNAVMKISKYVQIDASRDIVYISDSANGRIVSITFDGQALWDIKIGDEPKNLIFMEDYLLVTDFRRHQILQASCDGSESRAILTDDDEIWNPEYIMYNRKTKHLLVTSPENILIFKIL